MSSNASKERIRKIEEFLGGGETLKDKRFERKEKISCSGKVYESIIIPYKKLAEFDEKIANKILESPDLILQEFGEIARQYSKSQEPTIRITKLPFFTKLRDLSGEHIGRMVMLKGIINRVVPTRPHLKEGAWECKKCGEVNYVPQDEFYKSTPIKCKAKKCKNSKFKFLAERSTYEDMQELGLQERPQDIPSGQTPYVVPLALMNELTNGARAGEFVHVVGIVRVKTPSAMSKSRTFDFWIDVNYMDVRDKESLRIRISAEEEQEIIALSQSTDIFGRIRNSIAPSIYGHEEVKKATMYQLFGGVRRENPDITIRGDINVLLVGDPATAKSQILKAIKNVAPKAIYTSGKGSTAAGLTAAVLKSPISGRYGLEAGALVLASGGIALIDEIDKMNDNDRVAIHEAMEQQTISINKGGINTTLPTKASILAAANPTFGRYDIYKTIADNVTLPSTLLSRFDLIFILKDIPKRETDIRMAKHILGMREDGDGNLISESILRRYIAYSRRINPVLDNKAKSILTDFYTKMREKCYSREDNPIPFAARQFESLIRLTEAHARIQLHDKATMEDAEAAIDIMKESLSDFGIDPDTGEYDINIVESGKPKSKMDKMKIVLNLIPTHWQEQMGIHKSVLIEELKRRQFDEKEIDRIINHLLMKGMIYMRKEGYYARTSF